MTAEPEYIITEEQLLEIGGFADYRDDSSYREMRELQDEIRSRPAKESSDVLDELKGDRAALSSRLVQIYPQLNEDEKEYLFGCIEVILSRVELRSQHKGGVDGGYQRKWGEDIMKYICEKANFCNVKTNCLEAEPHEEKIWCKTRSKCLTARVLVKCIEVKNG